MDPVLRMRGVKKRFGGAVALAGVDFAAASGEVHALIGENGAGKSTLMKILAGVFAADEGVVEIEGRPFRPRTPLDARRQGIAMIYQELNLALDLTVAENVVLGAEPHRFGIVDRIARRKILDAALAKIAAVDLDPDARVAALGPGQRQVVEILRALSSSARVIVMDEPTSSLSVHDSEQLLRAVRALASHSTTIIYISHFLEEVERVADRYTVLRDGRSVASGPMKDTRLGVLVEQMLGRSIGEIYPRIERSRGEPLLGLTSVQSVRSEATLTLHRGEILGIAGLVGTGRTELLRAVFGLDPVRSGRIRVGAFPEDRGAPPWVRLGQRVGLLSEDRRNEGLLLNRSIAENVTLSSMETIQRGGVLRREDRRRKVQAWIERLGLRSKSPDQPVGELSGGNQQKVALARLLHHQVDVLLLDEPTRGIDIGSKVEIYRLMGELAAQGRGILLVSSYLPELLGMCDRLAVMHRGSLGTVRPIAEWTEARVLDEAARGAA